MAKSTHRRSGFLFVLVIFILLGLVVFAYKDKFALFFNTSINSGKNFFGKQFKFYKKSNNSKISKIDLFGKKDNKNSSDETGSNDQLKQEVEKLKETVNDLKDKINDDSKNEKITQSKETKEETVIKKEKTTVEKQDSDAKEKKSVSLKQNNTNQETNIDKLHNKTTYIYFSKITSDEKLYLIKVKRDVTYSDSPLTETLKTLLTGPSKYEKNSEVITNIPDKTRLLSVSIKDNVAYVNLSKEFELNPYGKEATILQLKQIVYTSTEFNNIKAVQFLIEGQVKTYLGGEGITINKPITRNDFS